MVNDDWHEGLTPEQCSKFIDDIRARGQSAFTGCHLNKEGPAKAGPYDRK
jgi:hypothetical protein